MSVKVGNEFTKWRARVADSMPTIAARVFALRDKMYAGCVFHYGMEKELGVCLAGLNSYDDGSYYHGDNAVVNQIVLQAAVSHLYRMVAKAEATTH